MTNIPGIGFAGLGLLGNALIQRLAQHGVDIAVWNRTPEAYHQIRNTGIQFASSFEALCADCDWLFSCVSDDDAFEAINESMLRAPVRPAIHVSFSTCSPQVIRKVDIPLKESGVLLVNCPVLGRPDIVKAGKAGFLMSGPENAVKDVTPIIEPLGSSLKHLGSRPEQSAAIKLALNFLIATTIAGLSETIAALRAQGIEGEKFIATISNTSLASPILDLFGQQILDQRYGNVLFDMDLAAKDVRYFQQLAESTDSLFLTDAVLKHIDRTKEVSKRPLDWSGLAAHLFPATVASGD